MTKLSHLGSLPYFPGRTPLEGIGCLSPLTSWEVLSSVGSESVPGVIISP